MATVSRPFSRQASTPPTATPARADQGLAVEETDVITGLPTGLYYYKANTPGAPKTVDGLLLALVYAPFGVQLAFNFCWSLIFFNAGAYGAALLWLAALWGLILWMILAFRRVDRAAALMQLPYLLWVSFAAYLHFGVWALN